MPRSKAEVKKVQKVQKATKESKVKKSAVDAKSVSNRSSLNADVFDTAGKKVGTKALPKELFGSKVNKALLAQALRIYFNNQTKVYGSTKTRSEVSGGGRKPWRQKGTGRARAGSTRSPLWVGGGITHGPKQRKPKLILPKKMKHQALISALSSKANQNQIKIISNIEKIQPKTKIIAAFLKKLDVKGSTLFVISTEEKTNGKNVRLAVRNIQKTNIDIASNLNAYEVVKNQNIFFSQEALGNLSGNKTK